jgi:lysozyme
VNNPNENMHASDRCKRYVKSKETCRLKAYADPKTGGAPWTCGWGSTHGVTEHTVWTQAEADSHFEEDILDAETLVKRFVTHPCDQGQFDAFVSIFQNVGPGRADGPGHEGRDGIGTLRNGKPSTLLRKFNDGDIAGAEAEWAKWCSPGSAVERGLRKRRYEELAMFRGEPE